MSNLVRQSSIVVMTALLVFVVFFSSTIFRNNLLAPGDAFTYSLPAFDCSLTPWSDLLGCGVPISADPQYQMWYPFRVLCHLFLDYNCLVICGYAIAASTSFAFTYGLTRSKFAAVVGALTYSMSGFMFVHLGHITIVHAAAWLPLLLFSIEKISRGFKWQWLLTGELSVALCMLGGHSQILLMQLTVGILYAAFLALDKRPCLPRVAVSFAAMCSFGLALVALQLLPTLELATFSPRNSWNFDSFVSFSSPPRQLAQLFFPFFFFKPVGFAINAYGQSPYFGEWSITELAGYVGILPLVLSLVCLARGSGRQRFFWLSIAVFSLIVTAGAATPLATFLYHVPVVNHFRCPARYVLLFDLSISVLAAYGVSIIERTASRRDRQLLIASTTLTVAVLGGVAALWSLKYLRAHFALNGLTQIDLSPLTNAYIGVPLILFCVTFCAALYWSYEPRKRSACVLLATSLFLDLASFDYFCEWRFVSVSRNLLHAPQVVSDLVYELRGLTNGGFRIIAPLGYLGGFKCCPPNLTSLWGLPSAGYYSPMCTVHMSTLLHDEGSAQLQLLCRYKDAAADLASVKYLLVPRGTAIHDYVPCNPGSNFLPFDRPAGAFKRFELLPASDPDISVYVNKRFLPRFRFVQQVVLLDDASAALAIESSRLPGTFPFEPATTAILNPAQAAESRAYFHSNPLNSESQLTVLQDEPLRKRLEVNCSENALLVIADQYYPGWSCTVDGKRAQLVRANYAFQGLFVARGSHLVELNYHSKSFDIGLTVSIFVLLVNLVGAVLFFIRRR